MTAYTPPPAVTIESSGRVAAGVLTEEIATRHAAAIKAALDGLEDAIADLPEGQAKALAKTRALRLHNQLGRGGRALNAHFQTAQVSPDSAGGDKDGGGGSSPS